MICPRCQKEVPEGPDCPSCGIVFAKYRARPTPAAAPKSTAPRAPGTAPAGTPGPDRPWLFRPVSDHKLAGLYAQLGRLLEAGLPLTEILRLLSAHSRGRLRAALDLVRAGIERGETLAESLSADPALFPLAVRTLVDTGEKTGGLPAAFRGLAGSLELRLTMKRRLLRACLYPFVLFTLSFFLLPLSKWVTAGPAAYLRASLLPFAIAVFVLFAVVVVLPWGLRRLLGEARFLGLLGWLPVVGKLLRLRNQLRFARHLSTGLSAGLDLFASVRLAAHATGDPCWVEALEQVLDRVRAGATLHEALAGVAILDPELELAIAAGEGSGKLTEALEDHGRLLQDAFLHRLEVAIQLAAVLVLLLVYAYVVWSVIGEYQNILGSTGAQIDELLREAGGGGGGALPPEIQELLK